jgi:hypothetical protein
LATGSDAAIIALNPLNAPPGRQFTPFLPVTHESSIRLFKIGKPVNRWLATLAEQGNVAPLRQSLHAEPRAGVSRKPRHGPVKPGSAPRLQGGTRARGCGRESPAG